MPPALKVLAELGVDRPPVFISGDSVRGWRKRRAADFSMGPGVGVR